jgi:hypothetical protein
VATFRFVAIEDLGAVTVGEVREAARRLEAPLGIVLEQSEPQAVLRFADVPSAAGADEPLSSYREVLRALTVVTTGIAADVAAESVAFAPRFAVLVHHRDSFVIPSAVPLSERRDLEQLIDSPNLTMWAALARLPGPYEPIPARPRRCQCPHGHMVPVPPGELNPRCPLHDLALMC